MKKLLWVLPFAASAQVMYLRTVGTPYAIVTDASNATPIRLTVSDASSFTDGDTVCVTEVRGNFAANGHLRAEESKHLARLVSAKSGNQFSLLDLSGAPVPGSGAYNGGGRVGKCSAVVPPSTHGVWFDGPAGPLSLALKGTARRNVANPLYTQLQNAANTLEAQPQSWGRIGGDNVGESGSFTIAAALRGYVDDRPAATAATVFDFDNPDQLTGTLAVDKGNWPGYTGVSTSGIDDYAVQLGGQMATAYSFSRNALTQSQRDRYNAYHFNDLPWQVGGTDFQTWAEVAWKINLVAPYTANTSRGSVRVSGTALIGTGTSFLADLAPGDVVFVGHPLTQNSYSIPRKVVSVTDNQNAVLAYAAGDVSATGCGGPCYYAVGPGWAPNQLGFSYHSGVFPYDWDHGGSAERYPFSYRANDRSQNLTVVRLLGHFARGVASCADTYRACLVAQRNYNAWFDLTLPAYLMTQTTGGFNSGSVGYNSWRVLSANLEMMRIAKASAGIDLCAVTGSFCRDGALFVTSLSTGGPGRQYMPWAEYGGSFFWTDQNIRGGFQSMALLPVSDPAVRAFADVWLNRMPIPVGARYAWWAYSSYDPATIPAAAELTTLGNRNYASECVALMGAAGCPTTDPARFSAVARSGFGSADTSFLVDSNGGSCMDHCYNAVGGLLTANRSGKFLLAAGDDFSYYPPPLAERSGAHIQIGNASNLKTWNSYDTAFVTVPSAFGAAGSVFWRANLTDSYKSGANATLVERQFVAVARGAGNSYAIQHDYVTLSAPGAISAPLNIPLNGVGTPAATAAIVANRAAGRLAADFGTAGMNLQVLPGDGAAVRLETEALTDGNLGYTGQRGYVGRVRVCLDSGGVCNTAAAAAEWITVAQINDGGGDTMPPIVQQVVGPHRVVEIQDSVAPVVSAFTRGGAAASSLAFTTTHAGTARYMVAGLNPAVYSVSVNGTPLAGSFVASATSRGFQFDSTAGAVAITASGLAALDLTTTAAFGGVPAAVVGTPYSLQFIATGGTAPYSLSLFSGSLPPGLTLSAGLLSGTPTTAGSYAFRLSVTDAQPASYDELFSLTVTGGGGGPPPPPVVNRSVFRGRRRGVWR
jgi:hypothetical protein